MVWFLAGGRISAKTVTGALEISRQKMSVSWIPKYLNAEEKRIRRNTSKLILQHFKRSSDNFLKRLAANCWSLVTPQWSWDQTTILAVAALKFSMAEEIQDHKVRKWEYFVSSFRLTFVKEWNDECCQETWSGPSGGDTQGRTSYFPRLWGGGGHRLHCLQQWFSNWYHARST